MKEVDSIVIESPPGSEQKNLAKVENVSVEATATRTSDSVETEKSLAENSSTTIYDEKAEVKSKEDAQFSSSPLSNLRKHLPLFGQISRVFKELYSRKYIKQKPEAKVETVNTMVYTSRTLARMAGTRRVVTSLGRLLGTKGEVITQIRKRLVLASVEANNASLGKYNLNDGEVSIYMGDIQGEVLDN